MKEKWPISILWKTQLEKEGCVKSATNKETNLPRAIKTIPKVKIKNWKIFITEVTIMRVLDHPNFIKLFKIFEDFRNVYLDMELCTGRRGTF